MSPVIEWVGEEDYKIDRPSSMLVAKIIMKASTISYETLWQRYKRELEDRGQGIKTRSNMRQIVQRLDKLGYIKRNWIDEVGQLSSETGVRKGIIRNYGSILRRYGILPHHKLHLDAQYSVEELSVLRRGTELIKSGMSMLDGLRLAVTEQFGENSYQVVNFDIGRARDYTDRTKRRITKKLEQRDESFQTKPLQKSQLNILLQMLDEPDVYNRILKRLSDDIYTHYRELFKQYPWNLYFSTRRIIPQRGGLWYIHQRLRKLVPTEPVTSMDFQKFEDSISMKLKERLDRASSQIKEAFREPLIRLEQERPRFYRLVQLNYMSTDKSPDFTEIRVNNRANKHILVERTRNRLNKHPEIIGLRHKL